jgi:hypothetical protein
MSLLQEVREKAKAKNKCIVLAEGEEICPTSTTIILR